MLEIWVVHVTYDRSLNWLHIMYTFDLETTIVNWHRYAPLLFEIRSITLFMSTCVEPTFISLKWRNILKWSFGSYLMTKEQVWSTEYNQNVYKKRIIV